LVTNRPRFYSIASSPGSRIVALQITQADLPGWAPLFRAYFHHVVPRVGGDREAYTYLPQSVDRFLTPPELSGLMEGIGLRGVKYSRLALGTVTIHTAIA
jgi:demethylmenaquinone methyltransferase/2-methoxy-6-polyprenyl-1,4-benzoquinol methylase